MRARQLLLALVCVACSGTDAPSVSPEPAPTQVHGTLLGHDGAPMEVAHVHLRRAGQLLGEVEVDADGGFELEVDGRDFIELRFTGVGHAQRLLRAPGDGGDHEIAVQLGTHPRPLAGGRPAFAWPHHSGP